MHWILFATASTPYGVGFMLMFMSLRNTPSYFYIVYAVSAPIATNICRSVSDAVVPLAARPKYHELGIACATSPLRFASFLMTPIMSMLIKYGATP